MLDWPSGSTTKAASSGPRAEPVLPPTWKSDWAKPKRPPEAVRATRELSGWKIAEPSPIVRRRDQRPVVPGEGEDEEPDEAGAHAEGREPEHRPLVGIEADRRLQQRGGAPGRRSAGGRSG